MGRWGLDAGVKGRVSKEALQLAGVDHSLGNTGKAEEHTGVDHGPPLGEDRIRPMLMAAPDSGLHQGPHG